MRYPCFHVVYVHTYRYAHILVYRPTAVKWKSKFLKEKNCLTHSLEMHKRFTSSRTCMHAAFWLCIIPHQSMPFLLMNLFTYSFTLAKTLICCCYAVSCGSEKKGNKKSKQTLFYYSMYYVICLSMNSK